jgi:arylsulfatase A-like enzyme
MHRRVVVVLTDGLRPDVVTPSVMPSLASLAASYTQAVDARTIRPSVTVAALGSIATGVSPQRHGLFEPGLGFLSHLQELRPVAPELSRHGHETTVVVPEMGVVSRSITAALVKAAGVRRLVAAGKTPRSIARAARFELASLESGVLFVYLADCDGAGHAHGWMSAPYVEAARAVDGAIGELGGIAERDLLIVMADHGGGGLYARDHDAPHPANEAIPLILSGPTVRRQCELDEPVSLLDVPPTMLWHLQVPVPPAYEGRVLHEAFIGRQALTLPAA